MTRPASTIRVLVYLLLAALASYLAPTTAASTDAAGRWEGVINLPGSELRVLVELEQAEGGAWSGQIDIPAQGAKDLPLTGIAVTGQDATFAIQGIPGAPTFTGTLAADGATLAGNFTQGGGSFPFRLERKASAQEEIAGALAGFADFVEGARRDWKVPGVAVAIVQDGQVVFAQGFGQRDVAKELPVTTETLFAIGSATKAFTAAAVASLVDEGKLDWDRPVIEVMPSFRLKDDFATQRMTPRDLLSHRSGLPRHDLVWYNAPLSRKEIFERLRYLEPNVPFRTKFQYQNLMFLTAGYLAGEVAGTSWEELVRIRLFQPLGMSGANFSVRDSEKAPDHALPYLERDGAVIAIPFRDITVTGPAGSINASARDMAKWAMLHAGDGTLEGRAVISAAQLAEMHRPHVVLDVVSTSANDPEIVQRAYGLGWFVDVYRGRVRVHHGGNIDGFSAQVMLVPAEKVGVVVLTNLNGTGLPEVVGRTALDRVLDLPSIDWHARLLNRKTVGEAAQDSAKEKVALERRSGTHPSHPLDDYTGEYEHPAYGVVTIRRDGDRLAGSVHDIALGLEHWHYDTFRATPADESLRDAKLFVQFQTNLKGDVDRLSVPFEPQVTEIAFTQRGPARLSEPAFLDTLVGTYALAADPAFTLRVARRGSVLSVSPAGQPSVDLVPYRGTEFALKGLTGFGLRFVLDDAGAVSELQLLQPDGTHVARRAE